MTLFNSKDTFIKCEFLKRLYLCLDMGDRCIYCWPSALFVYIFFTSAGGQMRMNKLKYTPVYSDFRSFIYNIVFTCFWLLKSATAHACIQFCCILCTTGWVFLSKTFTQILQHIHYTVSLFYQCKSCRQASKHWVFNCLWMYCTAGIRLGRKISQLLSLSLSFGFQGTESWGSVTARVALCNAVSNAIQHLELTDQRIILVIARFVTMQSPRPLYMFKQVKSPSKRAAPTIIRSLFMLCVITFWSWSKGSFCDDFSFISTSVHSLMHRILGPLKWTQLSILYYHIFTLYEV